MDARVEPAHDDGLELSRQADAADMLMAATIA
jgi:hypothetical protein